MSKIITDTWTDPIVGGTWSIKFDTSDGLHLGGTGTSKGTTSRQLQLAERYMRKYYALGYKYFHHGDCIKADEDMHEIAIYTGFKVIIHPPINSAKRAFCKGYFHIYPPKPYLDRNHDIVDQSNRMIALPYETKEQFIGSGTWATIRYSRKTGKGMDIIFP